jgi:hypothetical protein
MRCFNHHDRPAIGTCKECCKGLCTECAADLGHGLACKGQHESMVETLNTMITRNATAYSAAEKGGSFILPAFLGFIGVILIGQTLYAGRGLTSFGVLLGGGFIVFGVVFLLYNRRVFGPRKR